MSFNSLVLGGIGATAARIGFEISSKRGAPLTLRVFSYTAAFLAAFYWTRGVMDLFSGKVKLSHFPLYACHVISFSSLTLGLNPVLPPRKRYLFEMASLVTFVITTYYLIRKPKIPGHDTSG